MELEIRASGVFLMVNIKVFRGLHPQNPHQGPALNPLRGGEAYSNPPDSPTEIATCFACTMFALQTFSATQKKFLYYPLTTLRCPANLQ